MINIIGLCVYLFMCVYDTYFRAIEMLKKDEYKYR